MLLRILVYRFSPLELRRAARIERMSLDVIEAIYQKAAPGARVHTNQWGYLALWQKSMDTAWHHA
jgi:hypothetical protein